LEDNESLENIKRSVIREKRARNIKILFSVAEGSKTGEGSKTAEKPKNAENSKDCEDKLVLSELRALRYFFKREGYKVHQSVVSLNKDNIKEITKDYEVIVFCVPETEFGDRKERSDEMLYPKLSDIASESQKQCVLLSYPGRINFLNINPSFVTSVNFASKLRETVYMILYFSDLNDSSIDSSE
jgi:hypothetical protein